MKFDIADRHDRLGNVTGYLDAVVENRDISPSSGRPRNFHRERVG